jgi:hypothetical protein
VEGREDHVGVDECEVGTVTCEQGLTDGTRVLDILEEEEAELSLKSGSNCNYED